MREPESAAGPAGGDPGDSVSYERLRAALDSMLDPYVVLDAVRDGSGRIVDFVYREANPAACAFNGLPRDRLVGMRLLDLHPAAETSGLLDGYRAVVESGRPLVLDDWAYPQDLLGGAKRRYDVRAVRVGDGLGQTWRDVTARYEQGQELLASEHEHRLLAENAGDVVVRTRGGVAVWISPAVRDVLGWERADLIGTDLTRLVHPDDRAAIEAARATLAPGGISSLRYRVRTVDGAWRWVQVNTRLWVDDDGVVDGTVGTLRDVDAEVTALAALRRSREQLRGTVEAMLDPWILLEAVRDESGRIVDFCYLDANEAACRSNGVDRATLIGSRLSVLFPSLRESGAVAEYARVVETGEPLVHDDFPFTNVRTGASGFYDNRGVRVGDGLSLTWRDVSDRHRDVTDLAESRHRYRLLAENASDVVFRADPAGVLEWASPSVTALLGWDPADLVGRAFIDLAHPDDRSVVESARERLGTGADESFEVRFRRRDGGHRWLSVHVRAVFEDGVEVARVGGLRDIQAEVEARAALAESQTRYRLLAENATSIVSRTSNDGVTEWISPSVTGALGWAPEDVIGRPVVEFIHPDDLPVVRQAQQAARRGDEAGFRMRAQTADGEYRWFAITLRPTRDEHGTVTGRVAGWHDVHDEVEAANALAASEEHYRLLAQNSSDVVFRVGLDRRLAWASQSAAEVLGWDPDALVGRSVPDLLHPADVAALDNARADVEGTGSGGAEVRMRRADGTYLWMSIAGRALSDDTGAVVGFVGRARNIHTEHQAREDLARSEERFRTAMQSSAVGMATLDLGRRFTEVNPALAHILGVDGDWLLARSLADVLHPDDDRADLLLRYQVQSGEIPHGSHEVRLQRPDGTIVWVEHAIGSVRDTDGEPAGFVSQFVDITQARAAREHLQHQATRDPLTNLVNRRELIAAIERLLSYSPRTGTKVAILFIDLDGLKPINDTHGHAVGDTVIVTVAERIRAAVRADDVVARFGGDEYVAALPTIHSIADAEEVASKIHRSVSAPIRVGEVEIRATLSIGLVVAEPGDDPAESLRRADAALYRAKRDGRNRTATYDPGLDPAH